MIAVTSKLKRRFTNTYFKRRVFYVEQETEFDQNY